MRKILFGLLCTFLWACQSEPKLKVPAPEQAGGLVYTLVDDNSDWEAYLLGDTLTQEVTAFIYAPHPIDSTVVWQLINSEGIRSDALAIQWNSEGIGKIHFQPIHAYALYQQCDHRGFLQSNYTLTFGKKSLSFQVRDSLPKPKEMVAYRLQAPDEVQENVQQYFSERELTRDGLMLRVSAWATSDSLSFILKLVNRTNAEVFFPPDSLLLAWDDTLAVRPQTVMGDFKAAKGKIGLPQSGRGEFEWKVAVSQIPSRLRLYSPISQGLQGEMLLHHTDWLPWGSEPALSSKETQHD